MTSPTGAPIQNTDDAAGEGGTNLADLILEKIAAHEALQGKEAPMLQEIPVIESRELHPKVVQVYSTCVKALQRSNRGCLKLTA